MSEAFPGDAPAIARLRNMVADHLTSRHGKGHWSYYTSDKSVLYGMKGNSKVLITKHQGKIVGTLRLATKKPWAIDVSYFTKVQQALYLLDMAIHPDFQRKGIGTKMIKAVTPLAVDWPADSIRLDSYDTEAGAGEFYRKCGFDEVGQVIYKDTPLIYFEMLIG